MSMTDLTRRGFIAAGAGAAALGLTPRMAGAQAAIRLGVGSDPVFAAFFIAAHEKLFEAEGVAVDLQTLTDGGEAMNALVAGQVDLACASEPTNIVRLPRAELRPLAVVYESRTYIKLVTGPEVADAAAARRFGVVKGSISEYCTLLALEKLGIDPASAELVPSGPPELPALLARGDIDAFFAWEPWPTRGVEQGGKVALTNGDVGYDNTLWLTAAAALLDANPGAAQAVLRALAKGSAILAADPARGAAAVKAITRIPEETSLKAFADMTPVVRDFTATDLQSYDAIASFLAEHQVTEGLVPYRDDMQVGFYKG